MQKQRFLLMTCLLIWAISACSESQQAGSDEQKSEFTVGGDKTDFPGYTSAAIQQAIDALPAMGGRIQLDDGLYTISAPVRLRSNVT